MTKKTISTTCILDCPDTCALDVTVSEGKIEHIEGSNDHPDTNGFICSKVRNYAKRVYHSDRLLYPMRRSGAKGDRKFERISWDEAIEEITEKFTSIKNEYGGEAILPYHYGGSNGMLGDELIDYYYFAKLGSSRLEKTICAAPTTQAALGMYGKIPGVAFKDYVHAQCIIVWGANPKASNIHLIPYLKEAKKRGAFIAVVDPFKTLSSKEADLHVPVYPGTDLALALSMIRIWHEEGRLDKQFIADHTENVDVLINASKEWTVEKAAAKTHVKPEIIKKLADVYADSAPAVIRCGWGLERNRNGGQAVAAVLAMPALLGKFGVRGGGYTLSNGRAVTMDKKKLYGDLNWNTRNINMSRLGELLNGELDPPIKGLFVYNANPVAAAPAQNKILKGMRRDDLFTVVFDQVRTDTADYADILLPAVTFLEQHEMRRGYGSYVLGGTVPVIEALGEAKPNEWVFNELGKAMGWDDDVFSWNTLQLQEKVIDVLSLQKQKPDLDTIRAGKTQEVVFNGDTPIQFKSIFPLTSNKKANFAPAVLGRAPYHYEENPENGYPLTMISPATSKTVSTVLGEFNLNALYVQMHKDDAHTRNIRSGDTVKVFNGYGEVICAARVGAKVRQGVVFIPKGAWMKSAKNKRTSTALCPDHVSEVGDGACFNDALVEVELVKG